MADAVAAVVGSPPALLDDVDDDVLHNAICALFDMLGDGRDDPYGIDLQWLSDIDAWGHDPRSDYTVTRTPRHHRGDTG